MKSNYLQNMFSLEGKVAPSHRRRSWNWSGNLPGNWLVPALTLLFFHARVQKETVALIEAEGGKALDILADATDEISVKNGMEKLWKCMADLTL